jgi:hypothetical protein
VADYFGEVCWLEGRKLWVDENRIRVATRIGEFDVEQETSVETEPMGWLGIRSGLLRSHPSVGNPMAATVRSRVFFGTEEEWHLDGPGGEILKMRMRTGSGEFRVGDCVTVGIDPVDLLWIGNSRVLENGNVSQH